MHQRTIRAGLSAALTLCCLLGTQQQAHAQKYRLTDLGPGMATGIANDGTISGQVTPPGVYGNYHAVVWKPGAAGPTLLGEFSGDTYSQTTAISSTGTVIGDSYRLVMGRRDPIAQITPFIWSAATGLQPLPWPFQYPYRYANVVNSLGHLGGSSPQESDGTGYKLFLWRQGTGFSYITGSTLVSPQNIVSLNDQDQLVGRGFVPDGSGNPGYFWSPSTGIKPVASPSRTYSEVFPTTINQLGQVAGYLRDPATDRTKLFTWSARAGTTNLMPLSSYAEELVALSIDKNYRVIGNRHYFYRADGNNPPVPFVWTLLTGVKDLHSLIVNNGLASAPTVTITQLVAVNESGQIAAYAMIDNVAHVLRLDPVR